jgi:pSer/pThr/pTyr-binding forkhead associated (FHA) protein
MNKAFAGWYESLFGDSASDIRPKDVLRKIIGAMEDNRKEGLDNRVYVPNKYVLEIAFENEDEKEYLLTFLEKEELEAALLKYMRQNKYFMRGPLDFTLEDVTPAEGEEQPARLAVKCKWDVRMPEKEAEPEQHGTYIIPELADRAQPYEPDYEEEHTVAAVDFYDDSTVSPSVLHIKHPDGRTERFVLSKSVTIIGRSSRLDNDFIISKDGMVSKRHAKIVHGGEGFTVTDLESTNGTWIDGERISSKLLRNGDVMKLGATEITFEDSNARVSEEAARVTSEAKRPRLLIKRGEGSIEDFRLPSEAIIGRGLTSDVRFDNSTVSQRHARIHSPNGSDFYLEDLGSTEGTTVNGITILSNSPVRLRPGDRIKVGEVELGYEVD